VFHAAGDNQEFPFVDPDLAVAEAHQQLALYHQKQFVFLFVMVPDEFTQQFHDLYLNAVQVAHNPGLAVVGEPGEGGLQVEFGDGPHS
jgi:hypothetical protein